LSLLSAILLVLCLFLALRLRKAGRVVGDLLEAARTGKPLLITERGGFLTGFRLDELMRAFNRLISEKAAITDTGQEYFDQIQTTLGNLREAVVMVDRTNVIRLANPAFAGLVGVEEHLLGARLDFFLKGDVFHEFLREIRRSGEGRRKELEVQVNAKTRWLEVSAAPLQESARGEGSYTLFVFHDITRQKGLEKMRTEFVANVSHELRTPVTVIKGFAETLLEDDAVLAPGEKVRFLKKIRSNSERLHNLLQDLLLLSRLESTEMVLQCEVFSLSAFLAELTESWESELADSGQRLEKVFAGGDDRVLADPLRLSQVVTNLLENAHRHARGFTYIRVETSLEAGGVKLLVKDDGAGIPAKDLPHIFQRFYRVDKGRSRESGGTGLGLSIVKHIVVQHGGAIAAHSRQGEGTEIEILLPYAVAGDEQQRQPGG
jgi:two-component system, OmpR family, phosphate regulon sensor histidine kinase PhoR